MCIVGREPRFKRNIFMLNIERFIEQQSIVFVPWNNYLCVTTVSELTDVPNNNPAHCNDLYDYRSEFGPAASQTIVKSASLN